MATEKQIAANRANALRSTGPKTAAGRKRSSQNAFKHGLSSAHDEGVSSHAQALAETIGAALGTGDLGRDSHLGVANAFLAVDRVRRVKAELATTKDALLDLHVLKKLLAMERYERSALARRSREMERLCG